RAVCERGPRLGTIRRMVPAPRALPPLAPRHRRAAVLAGLARAALVAATLSPPVTMAGVPAPASTALTPSSASSFRFVRFDHAYSQPTAAVPFSQGKLEVRLSSPRNKIVVRANRLRLVPYGDGSHAAQLAVDFFGKGWLVADVDFAGYGHRFEEEVVVPP